jgi:catechol 2,3-dioxygenase-like lactoylglutathione lyase family enzyme
VAKVHHSAIVTRDVDASLVFWRDGLGLDVMMDETFEGPWPELFGSASTKLRSIFLGDASAGDSGIVELLSTEGAAATETSVPGPAEGFFLLSLFADLDEVLPRLAALGVGGEAKVADLGPTRLAVVYDPDGVRVELMDTAAGATLNRLTAEGDEQ